MKETKNRIADLIKDIDNNIQRPIASGGATIVIVKDDDFYTVNYIASETDQGMEKVTNDDLTPFRTLSYTREQLENFLRDDLNY